MNTNNSNRVVITAMEAVTPYGYLDETFANDLQKSTRELCDFPVPPPMYAKVMGVDAKLAYAAAKRILSEQPDINIDVAGLILGSTIPDMKASLRVLNTQFTTRDIFKALNCSPAASVAYALELRDMVIASSAACGTSLQSLALGYQSICSGHSQVVLVGGCDTVSPIMERIFNKLRIISNNNMCLPFYEGRDGTVLAGDSASMFLLESYEHAVNRGATILGEVIGIGMSMSSIMSQSTSLSIFNCMIAAYHEAINHEGSEIIIDCLNTHGTGTIAGDWEEATAIIKSEIPVNNYVAWKRFVGHALAASGLFELGLTMSLIKEDTEVWDIRCSYPTILPDQFKYKPQKHKYVMANSFGLGGINTSVVVKL